MELRPKAQYRTLPFVLLSIVLYPYFSFVNLISMLNSFFLVFCLFCYCI